MVLHSGAMKPAPAPHRETPLPDAGLPQPIAPARNGRAQRWFLALVSGAILLVMLVQARFFLIPLAIAVLLFSLTTAIIDFVASARFGGLRIPNWLASLVALLIIGVVLFGLFALSTTQIDTVMVTAPAYAERIQIAVAALFTWLGDDVAQGLLIAFQDIDVGAYIRAFAGSAGSLFVSTVLVFLYVGFLFAERPWFPAKIARLFPQPNRAREVDAILRSINRRIHHYILVKSAVSGATAILVYLVLVAFGLDFADTLAILTFVLNFIPNIGSILATLLPTLVALVQFDSWTLVIAVLAVVGTIQFSIGNVVEPMLMGRTLHLSSFAIILSLTFWGAVWGVVGMFLAVPLMVMVMIVCSHVPDLRAIAILLSRDGSLPVEGPDAAPADLAVEDAVTDYPAKEG